MKHFRAFIAGLIFAFMAMPALAQETLPGDACTAGETAFVKRTGGPETSGGHYIICDGSNWLSFLDYADSGRSLFQIDNDSGACTGLKQGRLRYVSASDQWDYCDGTSWLSLGSGSALAINDLTDAATNYTSGNMFLGQDAGVAITTGINNVVLGESAGYVLAEGGKNTIIGAAAGVEVTSGDWNTFVGHKAGNAVTTDDNNVAIGAFALDGGGGGSGWGNVAIGVNTLSADTGVGSRTVAIGTNSGQLATGDNNTFIGSGSGYNDGTGATTTGTDNILIGMNTIASSATASNELNIGNTIYGDLANDYVGINTNAPTANLHIKKTGTDAGYGMLTMEGDGEPTLAMNTSSATSWLNPIIFAKRSRGTRAAQTVVQDGDSMFQLVVQGYDGTEYEDLAHIEMLVDGIPGNNDMPGRIEFHTQANGSGGTLEGTTPEMVIKNNGNVGIGTGTPNDGKLEVKGGMVCVDTNSDDNATSCITAESDKRLKKNIKTIDNAVEKIQKIRGVEFDWRWDEYDQVSRFQAKPHSMGVIAQEVEPVFPEAMGEDINGFKSVEYRYLVAPLIEAVKEQQDQIEELKAQNRELLSRIERLENN